MLKYEFTCFFFSPSLRFQRGQPIFFFFAISFPSLPMQAADPNPNKDLLLAQPTDTVSALAWNPAPQAAAGAPVINQLAASTWDGNLLFYQVSPDGQFQAAQTAAHKAPVLDVAWALVCDFLDDPLFSPLLRF